MTMEAESRGHSHSPGTSGVPEAGRGRKDAPPEPLEGARPWDTSISDRCLQTGLRGQGGEVIRLAVGHPVCGHLLWPPQDTPTLPHPLSQNVGPSPSRPAGLRGV